VSRGFSARLHVLLAAKAPVGLVFRRGPANAVCTVGWNRETDKFELGQWLRGRIYDTPVAGIRRRRDPGRLFPSVSLRDSSAPNVTASTIAAFCAMGGRSRCG
jgi:hypothetical protein